MKEIQRILEKIKKSILEGKRVYVQLPRRCGKRYMFGELRKFEENERRRNKK